MLVQDTPPSATRMIPNGQLAGKISIASNQVYAISSANIYENDCIISVYRILRFYLKVDNAPRTLLYLPLSLSLSYALSAFAFMRLVDYLMVVTSWWWLPTRAR
jgi:hypothetical protein